MIREKKDGGRGETRTPDPLLAKQVLCQLSYTPNLELALILKHLHNSENLILRFLVITVPELSQNPQ